MRVSALLLIASVIWTAARVWASEGAVTNGFVSAEISGGAIRNLRVDPAGKGDYGPVIARDIYPGEQPVDPGTSVQSQSPDTLVFENVRVYSSPREVGVNEWDTPVRLEKGSTLGQAFTVDRNGTASVSVRVPTWTSTVAAMTLRLYRDGPDGKLVAEKRCENIGDNSWQAITFPAQDKGTFYLEMGDPRGSVGCGGGGGLRGVLGVGDSRRDQRRESRAGREPRGAAQADNDRRSAGLRR